MLLSGLPSALTQNWGHSLIEDRRKGSSASPSLTHMVVHLVRDRVALRYPMYPTGIPQQRSHEGSCRNTVFINHGLGHYSSLTWAPD